MYPRQHLTGVATWLRESSRLPSSSVAVAWHCTVQYRSVGSRPLYTSTVLSPSARASFLKHFVHSGFGGRHGSVAKPHAALRVP